MELLPQYLDDIPSTHKYKHGLPFEPMLAENLLLLWDRTMNRNKASLIIIDGGVGEGKTSLATHIADFLNRAPIDFSKQLAMGGEQLMKKLEICYNEKLHVLIYDEAGDFNRRGALTHLNKTLNRVFETYRAFKILVIVVLPNFHVLDKQLFDNKIPRLLLHLRGRTDNYGNFRAYSLYRMSYVRNWMQNPKIVIKEKAYNLVDPNFTGHFKDLPPERSLQLSKISTKGKLSFLKKSQRDTEGLVSYEQIATKIGRSSNWTRQAVSKLKIKPAMIDNKIRYFDDHIIIRLKEEIKKRQAE